MPNITVKDLLEAGVHFGHQTKRWNPKMKPYVYGARNRIYIIDLQKTSVLAKEAAQFLTKTVSQGKKVLFVGTKKQAREIVAQEAARADQFFVSNRWLGGTLTNYQTVRASVDRLKKLTQMKETGEMAALNKKHVARLEKQREKLEKNLGGIREMRKLPGALFIIDPSKEHTAVLEANKLGIPVVGIADTNCDPTGLDFVVPGNDDAIKAIRLFCSLMAESCIEGNAIYQEKLRANEIRVDSEDKTEVKPVSRFEGHVDIATPDIAELELEEEEKRRAKEAEEALAEVKAKGAAVVSQDGETTAITVSIKGKKKGNAEKA
jgi:small subunit ribosomal protein S2